MKDKEENKKKKKNIGLIVLLTIFVGLTIGLRYVSALSWGLSLIISCVLSILLVIAIKFKWIKLEGKSKEGRNSVDDILKGMNTISIKEAIEEKKYFIERAEKIYSKRKDRTAWEKIAEQIESIIYGGGTIVLLGIIMFGGLAIMFGVNNEFTNPTIPYNFSSDTLGNVSNAKELVGAAAEFTLTTLMNVGAQKPRLWFWLFWGAVLLFTIIPIFKICFILIKRYTKGRINKNGIV